MTKEQTFIKGSLIFMALLILVCVFALGVVAGHIQCCGPIKPMPKDSSSNVDPRPLITKFKKYILLYGSITYKSIILDEKGDTVLPNQIK